MDIDPVKSVPTLPVGVDRVPSWLQFTAAAIGLALAATGAVAVFATNNAAGAGSLVASGAVVGSLGMFANRIRSVEGGGLKFELAAAAVSTLEAANAAEKEGRLDAADALRSQAQFLAAAAEPIASKYERLRREIPSGWNRTIEMERLTADQGEFLAPLYPDVASVEELFDKGSDGQRWSAIAIMEHNPAIASTRIVRAAMQAPRSKFEQYHALKVIEAIGVIDPSSEKLKELRGVVADQLQEGKLGYEDSDRRILAERLLSRIR